ncbi:MAG TPA: DUF4352 domain-containing protein [Candidatus Stackebrandtia excrementipullorum]|nr:DUF4352 domain-containing protein [Candidatus Stackebrandtia excrementipullorum]
MNFRSTTRSTVVAAALLGLTFTFTACSSSDDDAAPAETETSVEAEAPEEEADEPAVTPGEETLIEIGESFEDPDIGDTIEILSVVRHFPSKEEADLIADGGEVVLVEVKVAPGPEYGGRISEGNFKISWDDGADFWNNKTRMVADEMDAADYPVLEDVSRIDGGEHTGWIAFLVDEQADGYLLQYLRPESNVIGSDDVLDEFLVEVEIPAL